MVKKTSNEQKEEIVTPDISSIEWTDYVLNQLEEEEKIAGNPTTDGLRRVFETVLNCKILLSTSKIVQTPDPNNEKRATVCHSITYRLNPEEKDINGIYTITVDGAADVYWGNCDKVFRNHPVAVAETRAEGRALRRALRLRKVVAAEELAKEIEDVDGLSVSKITNNQINFIDVLAKRLDIDIKKLLVEMGLDNSNIHTISHESAVLIVQKLSEYQQDITKIPDTIKSYNASWK